MDIILYSMTQEFNRVDKTLVNGVTYSGNFKGAVNVMSPVITIESSTGINANYVYIQTLGRFYFIKSIEIMVTGLYVLQLSLDVLQTYSTGIKNLTCIIKRNTNVYNKYLDDPLFKALNKKQIQTKVIENSQFYPQALAANSPCFVLTVAKGG